MRLLLQYFVQFWAPKYRKDLDILDKDNHQANQGLDGAQVIDLESKALWAWRSQRSGGALWLSAATYYAAVKEGMSRSWNKRNSDCM